MPINAGMMSSDRSDWETPRDLFDRCDSIWHFDLDVASSDENALCERHFTKDSDALKQSWGGAPFLDEPAIRSRDCRMGREGRNRVGEAEHDCRWATPSENRYRMVDKVG